MRCLVAAAGRCALLSVIVGVAVGCRGTRGVRPDEPPSEAAGSGEGVDAPTWRQDLPWTRLCDVAMDSAGRVLVVGHRLVAPRSPEELPRAVGFVTAYDAHGGLVWSHEIDVGWTEGVGLAVAPDDSVVAILHGWSEKQASAVLVRLDRNGGRRWQQTIEMGPAGRARDIAIGAGGEIAWIATIGPGAAHSGTTSRVTWVEPSGEQRWAQELAEHGSNMVAAGVTFALTHHVRVAGYDDFKRAWVLELDPEGGSPRQEFVDLVVAWDMAATDDGGVVLVGAPDERDADPRPIVWLDSRLAPKWRGGWTEFDEDWPTAVAVDPGGHVHALADTELVVGTEPGALRSKGSPGAPVPRLLGQETFMDVAVGAHGSLAFIGQRPGTPWGRIDAWIVRLEPPSSAWPQASSVAEATPSDPRGRWLGRPEGDHSRADAVLRWLAPRGTEPTLPVPRDAAVRRAATVALLRDGSVQCPYRQEHDGPDSWFFEVGAAGPHSTLDDPCVRLPLAMAWLDALAPDDLALVGKTLEELLILHGPELPSDVGADVGVEILEVAFALGHGPPLASRVLDGGHLDVQRDAIERLRTLGTPAARDVLHEAVNEAHCEIGMQAALALDGLGDPIDLRRRPADADPHQLLRSYCLLRHHPEPDLASAYWSSLLGRSGRYTRRDTCTGSWPQTEDEDPLWGPCEEESSVERKPPGDYMQDDALTCDELVCTIGREAFEENGPHGWTARLLFERGRDGKLFVDELEVEHWMR
jgi:hypothetical protein